MSGDATRRIGRFLVSPMLRRLDDGRYGASVSIRSGSGSTTLDRILRLQASFDAPADALGFATGRGIEWVRRHDATAKEPAWPRKN